MTNLETLQSLFNNRAFVIPDYQRGYAWETEQRTDLLSDLEDLAQMDAGKIHYTGTLVLHDGKHKPAQILSTQYKVSDIVDGQQRLTTLIILLLSVSRALESLSDSDEVKEMAKELRTSYIKRSSSQNTLHRLTLHGDTNHFFKDHIISDMPHPNPTVPAQSNLLAARTQFEAYLKKKTDLLSDEAAKIAFLGNFAYRITNRLGFVLYEVESEAEVGVMFEVMNARGRPLTQLEKVKNYLLYLVSRTSTGDALHQLSEQVNQTWSALLVTLSEAGGQADEDQFMRYHWAIYPGAAWFENNQPARTFKIHTAVKNTINLRDGKKPDAITADITQYLQSLRSLVVSYRDVMNPMHPQAFIAVNSGNANEKERLLELAQTVWRTGRTATVLPILMAAHHTMSGNVQQLLEIFRLCEVFTFRLGAVQKRADTGETYAYSLAQEMMKGNISFPDVVQKMNNLILLYCTDTQLKTTLLDTERNFYAWSGLRFFLYEYEKYLTQAAKLHFVVDWDSFYSQAKEKTVEHILPQGEHTGNVSYWSGLFTADEMASYRNRLGNLCLTNWNSSYSNKPFPEKRGTTASHKDDKVYQNSPWQNERELCDETDWTKDTIAARQEKLAQFALTRWHV